jgi:F-type H+-transporting ATPase subunit b
MDFPQFDSSTFTSQIFWLLLCSLCLAFFIKTVFLPRIFYILEARDKRISADAARTQEVRAAVSKLQAEYDEKVRQNIENAATHRMQKLAEFDKLRAERLAYLQKMFFRKRLAIEQKNFLNFTVNHSFVDVLLKEG